MKQVVSFDSMKSEIQVIIEEEYSNIYSVVKTKKPLTEKGQEFCDNITNRVMDMLYEKSKVELTNEVLQE